MEVALARRAVPEVRQRDDVVLADLRGPRRSDRLRDLRSDRTRDRHVVDVACAVMVRHLPTLLRVLSVPEGLRDVRLDRVPAQESHPPIPIRGETPDL